MSGTAAQPAETDPPAVEGAAVESIARRWGWKPKEEFRGPPDRWTSAEDFVARGENELPILRERNRNLDRQVEEASRAVTELNQMADDRLIGMPDGKGRYAVPHAPATPGK